MPSVHWSDRARISTLDSDSGEMETAASIIIIILTILFFETRYVAYFI